MENNNQNEDEGRLSEKKSSQSDEDSKKVTKLEEIIVIAEEEKKPTEKTRASNTNRRTCRPGDEIKIFEEKIFEMAMFLKRNLNIDVTEENLKEEDVLLKIKKLSGEEKEEYIKLRTEIILQDMKFKRESNKKDGNRKIPIVHSQTLKFIKQISNEPAETEKNRQSIRITREYLSGIGIEFIKKNGGNGGNKKNKGKIIILATAGLTAGLAIITITGTAIVVGGTVIYKLAKDERTQKVVKKIATQAGCMIL